jgi:hypothetical protein
VAETFLTCNTDVTIQVPIYAEVDLSKKTKHKEEINIPMYAQVDKSKKRVNKYINKRFCFTRVARDSYMS